MVVAIAAAMYGLYELFFGFEPTAAPMVPNGPPQAPQGPIRDMSVSLQNPNKETPWWHPTHEHKLYDPWALVGFERPHDWIITDKDKFNHDFDSVMNHSNGFDNLSKQNHSQETRNKMRQEELKQWGEKVRVARTFE